MSSKVLIVEDQFIEANNLKFILRKAGYKVCPIAASYTEALTIIEEEHPDLVLLDIILKGKKTGIDLAKVLKERKIAFVYLSANVDKAIFDAAKLTGPYGFLVKPFRERDVMNMLDIATYLHEQSIEFARKSASPDNGMGSNSAKGPMAAGVIGSSGPMLEVMGNVRIVGPTDTSVLILGESGTGKELVARAIHEASSYNNKGMIVVNCGALPTGLIESELFGHERGSFTGASDKRTGKFEQANNSTIFLDEIGELPLDVQTKFLRVLQEKEIEPIGGKTRSVNVRIVAATNRNLEEAVAAGRFRMDLYYRLNVFPILMPPLRERQHDITVLAEHFLKIYATKSRKEITGISPEVKKDLMKYHWPGNVRELENVIARGVLMTDGNLLAELPLPAANTKLLPDESAIKTITQNERDHILMALDHCNWKIYGPDGAAELLDINSSTLKSRMKKLGITRKFFGGTDES